MGSLGVISSHTNDQIVRALAEVVADSSRREYEGTGKGNLFHICFKNRFTKGGFGCFFCGW